MAVISEWKLAAPAAAAAVSFHAAFYLRGCVGPSIFCVMGRAQRDLFQKTFPQSVILCSQRRTHPLRASHTKNGRGARKKQIYNINYRARSLPPWRAQPRCCCVQTQTHYAHGNSNFTASRTEAHHHIPSRLFMI